MSKKRKNIKNNKKLNSYAFGAVAGAGAGSGAGSIISQVAPMALEQIIGAQKEEAKFENRVMNSDDPRNVKRPDGTRAVATSTVTGAAQGFSVAGPWGAVVGGAIGLGSGLISNSSKQKEYKRLQRVRQNAVDRNKMAFNQGITEQLANEYETNNPVTATYAMGKEHIARVDNKEIIQYANGHTLEVNGNPNVVDSEIMSVPPQTVILSNRIYRPGTKETFAKAGKQYEKILNKKYQNQDAFSRTSKQLNDEYANARINDLQTEQAMTKQGKPKVTNSYKDGKSRSFPLTEAEAILQNRGLGSYTTLQTDYTGVPIGKQEKPIAGAEKAGIWAGVAGSMFNVNKPTTTQSPNIPTMATNPIAETSKPRNTKSGISTPVKTKEAVEAPKTLQARSMPNLDASSLSRTLPVVNSNMNMTIPKGSKIPGSATVTQVDPSTGNNGGNMLSNLFTDYLSMAPYRYNSAVGAAGFDVVGPTFNPYASTINKNMRARRISMEPTRQAINRQRSVSNYNARNITNTGQGMAYRLANEAMSTRAEVDAINQAQQVNNNYVAEYSNMMNNLGQQDVNAMVYADDMTARNKAARDQHRAAAATQLSQWAQNRQLMNNQASRDQSTMDVMKPFMENAFSKIDLATIMKGVRR